MALLTEPDVSIVGRFARWKQYFPGYNLIILQRSLILSNGDDGAATVKQSSLWDVYCPPSREGETKVLPRGHWHLEKTYEGVLTICQNCAFYRKTGPLNEDGSGGQCTFTMAPRREVAYFFSCRYWNKAYGAESR